MHRPLAGPGAVETRQVLFVLEAMKMENPIGARPGQNEVLAEIG